jgi:hypothetical protein
MRQPQNFQAAMTEVMKKDRDYFLNNPGATHYTRPFVPGEAPLIGMEFTKVTQVYPGFRTRRFFYRAGGKA